MYKYKNLFKDLQISLDNAVQRIKILMKTTLMIINYIVMWSEDERHCDKALNTRVRSLPRHWRSQSVLGLAQKFSLLGLHFLNNDSDNRDINEFINKLQ